MGFNPGGGGGGSSSIAGSTDVVLNNPATGEVLAYNASLSKWQNQTNPSAPVTSVAGKTGAVTLTKTDVGLSNVDNTSDANKPVSTAQATALAAKANTSVTITAGTGLTGGGTLAADRTLAVSFPASGGDNGTASTAARSDHAHDVPISWLPAQSVITQVYSGAAPSRPTARTDVVVWWIGPSPQPAGMITNDIWDSTG